MKKTILALIAVLSLVAVGIFIWLPHRIKAVETHITLQGGKQMDACLLLQVPWGSTIRERLVGLTVSIAGKSASVPQAAISGVPAADLTKKPVIVERKGFPEVILWTKDDTGPKEVHFRFQNYSFSERRIVKDHKSELAYYAMPLPPPQLYPVKQGNTPTPTITLGEDSIKSAQAGERK